MSSAGGGHRPPERAAGGEIPTAIVIAVSLVTIAFIGACTALIAFDKPVDNLMLIVGAYLAPTVTTLLASRKFRDNTRTLASVEQKVDHTVNNLITDKAILEQQVTYLGDIPATLPARRATDTKPQSKYPPPTTEIQRNG